jgi:hypothetical protein
MSIANFRFDVPKNLTQRIITIKRKMPFKVAWQEQVIASKEDQ